MDAHSTQTERAWHTEACQLTARYENHLRERERVNELAKRKAEFSQKQADRLMMLAEGTDDPQLRVQLVILSNDWVDESGDAQMRFKLLHTWRRHSDGPLYG